MLCSRLFKATCNYRASRARIMVECAYGQLKGRCLISFRKNESSPMKVRSVSPACVVSALTSLNGEVAFAGS